MFQWLRSLFGTRDERAPAPAQPRPRQEEAESRPAEPRPAEPVAIGLAPEARAFYLALVAEGEPLDLQALAGDDRLFISGVLKRLREKRLEIPVLPRAAIEISKLLSDPNSGAADFSRVLESDPALSVDVLRIANSAFYGFGKATDSVRDAVVRIGLAQLRGLVIVTHLNGKVLQGGVFRQEAAWLSDLSLALAQFGQSLAPALGVRADAAFTRGMLMHVEHFVIMGSVGEVSRDHQRKVLPTSQGLLEALLRCGTKVRSMAASEWGLEDLLAEEGSDAGLTAKMHDLRRALVASWSGEERIPTEVAGVPPERLTAGLRNLTKARAKNAENGAA